jgi:hypothetical protein
MELPAEGQGNNTLFAFRYSDIQALQSLVRMVAPEARPTGGYTAYKTENRIKGKNWPH